MALSPAEREALLNFLGFGNPTAQAVFIGMEDGYEEPPSLEEQLRVRASFSDRVVDLRAAANAHPPKYLSGARPPIQRTWNVVIRVLLAFEGTPARSNDDVRYYQRDRLGRATDIGALFELMPLPTAAMDRARYRELFPEFVERRTYARECLERRIALLRRQLAYGPRLVVAHGAASWEHYRRLFPSATAWATHEPFAVADVGPTRVVLAPHFTARTMNGRRDDLIALATRA